MPPMLRELEADQDNGLLGYRMFPGLREFTLLRYWRLHPMDTAGAPAALVDAPDFARL